ncbi:MAG: hypothetical protein NTY22_03210, partial [Proteobacteria bacterium]|nr:hypothetical protein [Pseudomonadota bacterium]
QSRNIMIRKIQAERIIINESDSITIESCIFEKYNQPLFLKDSSDVLILSNIFKNMNIAIVLKSTVIDIASLLSNNNFESVQNKIRNLQ